ncbi:isopropylmalate isomerase [Pseudopontixanthobacter vadosimaris]|uniref:isopropylmalate isomerase n=1 Tax=Pseudopontixanthobacter vadosimaris TaxID=2726450 RepID=UPI001472D640|nr:isopropylmalate isomerase [Pseudopontixanthobacter vadosimaris]
MSKSDSPSGKVALAGAIGSAAIAAALLYASKRRTRAEDQAATPVRPVPPETD